MKPILEVRAVTRRFGGVTAVSDVSLDVPARALTAVIGPNGAGKTTLFNIIAGAIPPSEGTVLYEGADITAVPMHRRVRHGLSRTFQNMRLVPGLTVRENVLLGSDPFRAGSPLGEVLKLPGTRRAAREARDAADALLDRVGLLPRVDDEATSLAYGEGKLLELARALAARPRLLLLDEPAAGLPHAEAFAMADLIRSVVADNVTILLVEHNMGLVMRVADRIMVMAHGRRIALGDPAAIRTDPHVIEAYLGSEDEGVAENA